MAERVADERCEPSPGLDGSLVGYQVRLDSARYSLAIHCIAIILVLI